MGREVVQAAFGAPIGGVLFSMEEACSFWTRKVAWRCFVAAILAAFALSVLSESGDAGVIVFDNVQGLSNIAMIRQSPLIVLVAAFGGLIGALFNRLRRALWPLRASRSRKFLRIAEALLAIVLSIGMQFVAATTSGRCMDIPEEWETLNFEVRFVLSPLPQSVLPAAPPLCRWAVCLSDKCTDPHTSRVQPPFFKCPEGKHNDLATAFFSTCDKLLGTMFSVGQDINSPGTTDHNPGYSQASLITFSAVYLVMMAIASGVCVPAGLFMPSIMLGASTGLSLGIVLQQHLPGWHIQPGAALKAWRHPSMLSVPARQADGAVQACMRWSARRRCWLASSDPQSPWWYLSSKVRVASISFLVSSSLLSSPTGLPTCWSTTGCTRVNSSAMAMCSSCAMSPPASSRR